MLMLWLRTKSNVQGTRPTKEVGVPVWFVGSFERLSAFALGLFNVEGGPVILGAWLAAKLAASWQRYPTSEDDPERNREVRVGHLVALIVGIVSVAFAFLVGHWVRQTLNWE
jgi:hypothetical protein